MTWRPWTRDDLDRLLGAQLARLSFTHRTLFTMAQVQPRLVKSEVGPGQDGRSMWVIAEHKGAVLYWDSTKKSSVSAESERAYYSIAGRLANNWDWPSSLCCRDANRGRLANSSVNLPIRSVTVRACARPAPGRLAGYADR